MLCCGLVFYADNSEAGDTFQFSGDSTAIVLAEGKERTLLEGDAEIISDDITLRAQSIELYGTDFRYAETTEKVEIIDSARDMTITAHSVLFDRETENARAHGDVIVDDRENELIAKSGYLETREGGDLLLMQTSVRVLQDDLIARAQFLRYRRVEEVLELSGFPIVYWKGDEYRATRIVLNLDTEEIELQGRVEGEVVVDEDEEDVENTDAENGDVENADVENGDVENADVENGENIPIESEGNPDDNIDNEETRNTAAEEKAVENINTDRGIEDDAGSSSR